MLRPFHVFGVAALLGLLSGIPASDLATGPLHVGRRARATRAWRAPRNDFNADLFLELQADLDRLSEHDPVSHSPAIVDTQRLLAPPVTTAAQSTREPDAKPTVLMRRLVDARAPPAFV